MDAEFYFSPSRCAWYAVALKEHYGGNWPDDAKPVDQDTYLKFAGASPSGKMLTADANGDPSWTDLPPSPFPKQQPPPSEPPVPPPEAER